MKKALIALSVVVVLAGGYLGLAHFSGGAFPTLGLPLGGDVGHLRRMGNSFLEDIQFKDFKKAASYHAPELQESVDIPFLIWRMFKIKPEALDLMEYDVVFAEMDKSKLRGRVKMRMRVKVLLNNNIEDKELMLYFERKDLKSPWYMKLEDSLRKKKADDDKKT